MAIGVEFLKHYINRIDRDYFIEKANRPLMKAIITLSKRYPEPTRLNCVHPNSYRLIDIRDKFFEYEDNPGRKRLFEALFRIFIVKYEHSPYFSGRMDWALEMIDKLGWKPRALNHPVQCWNEPKPFGGVR